MPQKKDQRQHAILLAATEAFKEKGFEGARVDQIAEAAGVNKATLYYRIGDKAALYAAVLDFILRDAADAIENGAANNNSPEEKLKQYVMTLADTCQQFAPIMLRELAAGGKTIPDLALSHMGRIVDSLRLLLQQGVESGDFRPTNPFIIHMMVIGGLSIYASNQPLRQRSAEQHPDEHHPEYFITQQQAAEEIYGHILTSLSQPSARGETS
ncbi:MAG: TetR/AcrR family transcriptional regulator [Gammaproteobacteria bacterium]|nr:TetR/AcrR family transcriptional regulator [Gammaproteobacteria bacterium]